MFATWWSTELPNGSFKDTFLETLWFGIDSSLFVFINLFLKIVFKEKLTLRSDFVASSGGQWKQTYFVYFPQLPLAAWLSAATLCFLFTWSRRPGVRIHHHTVCGQYLLRNFKNNLIGTVVWLISKLIVSRRLFYSNWLIIRHNKSFMAFIHTEKSRYTLKSCQQMTLNKFQV